jgi:hypothetical protein
MPEKSDKPKDTSDRLAQRRKKRSGKTTEVADWESLNSTDVLKLIALVTGHGGSITFGYTRDGGAYYLSYFIDGQAEKEYFRPTEDVDKLILIEIESWEAY